MPKNQSLPQVFQLLPSLVGRGLHHYFRVQIEGAENLPVRGPALIVPNHSGFAGLDAVLLGYEIERLTRRRPKIMTHRFWFLTSLTGTPMEQMGFVQATKENGRRYLRQKRLVVLFPEGEQGNFKPSRVAYRLQEFKRGFVRLALETGTPIVPTLILGSEESQINLGQIRLQKLFPNQVLPLPLNLIPFPFQWTIRFLPARTLPFDPEDASRQDLVHELAEDIQESMQDVLTQELRRRKRRS